MKINFIKQAGGVLLPANDHEAQRLNKFKTGELYEVEIKLTRNPAFHRKMFAFFNFCFQYWRGDNEFQDEIAQFDKFRKDLTMLAGYRNNVFNMRGELRVEPESLSFASMDQERFEQCYNAMIQAAIRNVFGNTKDQNIINQLYNFF